MKGDPRGVFRLSVNNRTSGWNCKLAKLAEGAYHAFLGSISYCSTGPGLKHSSKPSSSPIGASALDLGSHEKAKPTGRARRN